MKRSFVLLLVIIPTAALTIISILNPSKKIIYNGSKSAPIGFYFLDQKAIKRGDFVVVSVPKYVRKIVLARRYLPLNTPLLKRVLGMKGDRICRKTTQVFLNGRLVAIAKTKDNFDRIMPIWSGCHTLAAGDFFLLQDHPLSFDGRYFGPIRREAILARAHRIKFLNGNTRQDNPI